MSDEVVGVSIVPPFTVREGLWDENTKILEVKKYRHKVAFRESPEDEWRESSVMPCNNCGSVYSYDDEGKTCAGCGMKAADD